MIKKVKNAVPLTYVYNDFNGKEIAGSFHEKELWKKKSKEFRLENIINRKGAKIYVIWKGYDGLFNSWINKKRFSINTWIFSRTEIFRRKSERRIRFE